MTTMPVYSVPIPESSVLTALEGAKHVRIMGCGFCDNWSFAYHRNRPIYELKKEGDNTIRIPVALSQEANHYKNLLEAKGAECDIEFVYQLCQISDDIDIHAMHGNAPWTQSDWVDRCRGSDAVLSLGCSAALVGLKKRLGDDVKVVPGLKTTGAIQLKTYLDESKRYIMLDKEGSTVIEYK